MIRLKKNSVVLLFALLPTLAFSQAFKYKCQIKTPDSSGFYSILITPQLSGHIKTDLTDIRVIDSKGQWIPHIVRTVGTERKLPETVDLKVLSIDHESRQSIVIVENDAARFLDNFILRLKNAATERMSSLSGSDDNKTWYIIVDSILLSQPVAYAAGDNVNQINFPLTQYRYFKLTIRNSGKDPLNLLAIKSITHPAMDKTIPLENPFPSFERVDSANWSLVHVTNKEAYQMNQLALQVNQPAYFDRAARIYLEKKEGIARTWNEIPLWTTKISSSDYFTQPLPLVKAKEFYIIISNEDNQPLGITSIRTYQPVREIVAYLEKGKSYELAFDNTKAAAPNYDLNEFAGKIPVHPPALALENIVSNAAITRSTTESPSTWWIWLTIAAVTCILAYLTWQLTKDMNRKNEVS